jgi:lipid-A-disaccharide synthase
MKNIWILSGEASGDMYGAKLAEELRLIAAAKGEEIHIAGMGGPKMIAAGIDIRVDSTELGVIGFVEILKHIFTFINIFFKLVKQAKTERPDRVVLIDYPGFNLLFALVMYCNEIPVIWYVCPHLWVWGKWRLPVLAKICSKMLVIFPFEVEVFAETPLKADFVGHPLVDIVEGRRDPSIVRDPNAFLLLPGSRTMEIERLLPTMLEAVYQLSQKHPQLRFYLSTPRERITNLCLKTISEYREKQPDLPQISVSTGDTGVWQQKAGTGLAASGTVTVESAIAGLPLVVGYRTNWLSIIIAILLQVKLFRGFFTMTNIIANKVVYEEFLQHRFKVENIVPAVERILPDGERRLEVEAEMAEVRQMLSAQSGSAARQAALAITAEEA